MAETIISGTITEQDTGEPIKDVVVRAWIIGVPFEPPKQTISETITDELGHFELKVVTRLGEKEFNISLIPPNSSPFIEKRVDTIGSDSFGQTIERHYTLKKIETCLGTEAVNSLRIGAIFSKNQNIREKLKLGIIIPKGITIGTIVHKRRPNIIFTEGRII